MANRTMAAKALKLKKMKRLFPKQYQANYIPVGRGPNMEVMAGYKERAKGLAFDQKFLDSSKCLRGSKASHRVRWKQRLRYVAFSKSFLRICRSL